MFTVYSMGDMPIFASVLNAIAMAFNSSMFDPSQGAGIVVIGLLIGIFYMILPAATSGKLNAMPFVLVMIVFWGGVVPKETVVVEDIYTGNITAVDNIPLIVALPASVMATVSKSITENVETSFQTTTGSYLSMGAEGFVNPLKILLSLRNPEVNYNAFPNHTSNIVEFVRYCAYTDPAFTQEKLKNEKSVLDYFVSLNTGGIMLYLDSANPQGITVSCKDGAQKILDDGMNLANGTNVDINNAIKANTTGEYAKTNSASSTGPTALGISSAYNALTAGLIGNQQSAQQFIINAIAMAPTKQGIDCINQPTGANAGQCMADVMLRINQEQTNMDAAGQASMFTAAIIPMMNILLVMFYAFSPIIIAVAFLSGPNAIKVLGGFIMFGAWTQSWMPISAIINYLIQMQVQYAFADLPTNGFTMANHMQFYHVLSMKIGVASTMLAMVPMISYALLSGSMHAMSQVGSKMSGKDNFDEKPVAPGMSDIAKVNPWVEGAESMKLKRVDGSSSGGAVLSNQSNSILGSYEISATLAQSQKEAEQYKYGKQQTAESAINKSLEVANTKNRKTAWSIDINNVTSTADKSVASYATKVAENFTDTKTMSREDKEVLKASISLMMAGNGVAAEKNIGTKKALQEAYQKAKEFVSTDTKSRELTKGFDQKFAKALATENSTSHKFAEGESFSSALKEYSESSKAYEDATQWTTQAGSSNKQDFDSLGAQFQAKFGPESEQMIRSEAKDEKQFQNSFSDIYGQLKTSTGITKEDEEKNTPMVQKLRTAAMLKALELTNAGGFTKLLGNSHIGGIARNTSGDDSLHVNEMDISLQSNRPSSTHIDIEAKNKGLDKPQSAGANIKLVEGKTRESKTKISQAELDDKNNYMQRGAVRNAEKANAGGAEAMYKMHLQLNGLVNDHGDIAGMANVADAIRQWQNFEHDHPVAAAALTAIPIGRAVQLAAKAGEGLAIARTAVTEARAAQVAAEARAAQSAKNASGMGTSAATRAAEAEKHAAEIAKHAEEVKKAEEVLKDVEKLTHAPVAKLTAVSGTVALASNAPVVNEPNK